MLQSSVGVLQKSKQPLEERGRSLSSMWRVVRAEWLKQRRTLLGSNLMYISMVIWPGLQLAQIYYTFLPFVGSRNLAQHWDLAKDPHAIVAFFILGMLGYVFFRSIVQSSWQFSFERFNGTLEILFLTPANRLVLILANGVGALVQSAWLFLAFSVGLILLVGGLHLSSPLMLLVAFLGMLFPALGWAALLNSICIFSRDSSFVFTVIESTMQFFSGTRIPLPAMPIWVQAIGLLFPLTTSLVVLRDALLSNATLVTLWPALLFLFGFTLLMLLAALLILHKGEQHARMSGSLTLF